MFLDYFADVAENQKNSIADIAKIEFLMAIASSNSSFEELREFLNVSVE